MDEDEESFQSLPSSKRLNSKWIDGRPLLLLHEGMNRIHLHQDRLLLIADKSTISNPYRQIEFKKRRHYGILVNMSDETGGLNINLQEL